MRRSLFCSILTILGCQASALPEAEPSGDVGGKADGAEGSSGELTGVADLHLHMFAEHAFGGGWLHGRHDGTPEEILGSCDGGGDHARLQWNLLPAFEAQCDGPRLTRIADELPLVRAVRWTGPISGRLISGQLGAIEGGEGDTGRHERMSTVEPGSWPRWDSIAHQQSWEAHLEQAWRDGLRLEVVSAVSFDWLCRMLPDDNLDRPECSEMADVFVQLEAAHDFAERTEWAEIALSAADARRIISGGKLALVLSVEASHIMGDVVDWRESFERLYDLGVRTLQPVHQLDNRFAGAALHNTIHHLAMYTETCHIDTDCALTTSEYTLGFDVDESCKNVRGLTADGEALIREMADRGMLIDAAHFSERSLNDLYRILTEEYDYYPFYLSHGHFREIMLEPKQREEKTTPFWVAPMLRQTGGMFGIRTFPDEVNTYAPSPVDNTCHGSSRSFAQAYDYGRLGLEVPMGLGADFNGFIAQTRPRFGPDACSASFAAEGECQRENEIRHGAPRLGTDFDEIGLGHTGVLIDLLDDLDQLGTDTTPLRESARTFVEMWERSEGRRSGPVVETAEVDTSGIEVLPSHDDRFPWDGCGM